jgi:hypothetical protein
MTNVRININDLVRACRALHDVRVVAAGSMYATLELDDVGRATLSRHNVNWNFD